MYSTCTLNPVEDEAVICTLLQKAEGIMYTQLLLPHKRMSYYTCLGFLATVKSDYW